MAKKENALDLYKVDKKYIRDLSKVDDNVMSVSPQIGKDVRPFIGVVVIMGEKGYCIPLTSPKDKFKGKSKEDYIKIPDPKLKDENGAPKTIGILNINNMIPVSKDVISKINLTKSSDIEISRLNLLKKEIAWCRDNIDVITNRANKIYRKVTITPEKSRDLTRRCCDFKKLESVLDKWLAKNGITETAPGFDYESAYKHCKKVIDTTNEILNENPKLKAAFAEAKKVHQNKASKITTPSSLKKNNKPKR